MPTPANRAPVRIARGNLTALQAGLADLLIGEIAWAKDTEEIYVIDDDGLGGKILSRATAEIDLTNQSIDELQDVDTSTTAPTNGEALIWNSTTSVWEPGPSLPDLASSSIDELSDVDTTTVAPAAGEALVWDSVNSKWAPGAVASANLSIDDLNDVDTVTNPPLDGEALVWDDVNDEWVPGNSIPDLATSSIDELGDVNTSTVAPSNGQTLIWDSTASQWKPGTASTVGAIDDLSDVDTTTTAPTSGQALVWNSTSSLWVPGTVATSGVTFTSSATPPVSPSEGDEWLDSNSGTLYKYIDDGNSLQWLELGPISGSGGPSGGGGFGTAIIASILF